MGCTYYQMQEKVANLYPGATWKYRVYHQMSREQVIAIYHRSVESGAFERAKQRRKVEKENAKVHQMNLWDWLKGRKKDGKEI